MADETDNETPESAEPEPEVQASEPQAEEQAKQTAAEAPAEQEAPEVAVETPAEAPAEQEVAPDAAAEASAAPAAPAAPSEPAEQISPKVRRRRERSTHTGQARPSRTPEERHAERVAERRVKAVKRRARRLQERAKAADRRKNAPVAEPLAPVHAPVEGSPKVRQGIVVSDKADKTITVRIDVARRHRRYEKIVRSSNTLHAHDEDNDAHEGDVVRVIESRPLSRTKRWKLVDVLERAR
jgi:small subunit ribosomal protein S17